MTREEALAGHRKLWNEIADMIENGSRKYNSHLYVQAALERLGEEIDQGVGCYICAYAKQNEKEIGKWACGFDCPLKCRNEKQLFEKALCLCDYTQAAFLARTIANLPERVVE